MLISKMQVGIVHFCNSEIFVLFYLPMCPCVSIELSLSGKSLNDMVENLPSVLYTRFIPVDYIDDLVLVLWKV